MIFRLYGPLESWFDQTWQPGDTIAVAAGRYDEALVIPAPDLTLVTTAGATLEVPFDGIGITIGSDDGLLKGHRLDVYRTGGQGTYLGKIEVIYTDPDKAVCKVLPEFRKGIIQANDRVTTGLKSQ